MGPDSVQLGMRAKSEASFVQNWVPGGCGPILPGAARREPPDRNAVHRSMKKQTRSLSAHDRILVPLLIAYCLLLALPAVGVAKPDHAKGKGKAHGAGADFVPPGLVEKGGVPPGLRRAPVEIVVTKVPPPVRIEKIPARPGPRHVWVPGYWIWDADAYIWLPGAWILPPEPAAVWVPPRFERRSGVSIFISGYWKL